MFYCKNQKFHKRGIAFTIPDDSFLLEHEKKSDELFEISVADDLFRITIGFEFEEPSRFFESDDFKNLYTVIESPSKVSVGDLSGQKAIYADNDESFCEYRLKITDKSDAFSTLFVLIQSDNSKTDILKVCNHPAITNILDSLELSK